MSYNKGHPGKTYHECNTGRNVMGVTNFLIGFKTWFIGGNISLDCKCDCGPISQELINVSGELNTVILLNGYHIKPLSKFLSLCP